MLRGVFNIPIYFGRLVILVGDDFESMAEKIGVRQSNGQPFRMDHYSAIALKRIRKGGNEYYIFLTKESTPWSIAHECKHIVNYLFADRGIDLDLINDEPECYLMGWVYKTVYLFHEKCKLKDV